MHQRTACPGQGTNAVHHRLRRPDRCRSRAAGIARGATSLGGFFRLLVPRALGGEELDWPEFLEVVRTIAEADGSTGWCVNQAAVFATVSARVPPALAGEVWGDPLTVVGNGPAKFGESVPVEGGYRLTGRWMFSSGCRHANWIAAVTDETGPDRRLHMLPPGDVDFVDVWDVQGLRGTGSFNFETKDRFVPAEHTAVIAFDAPEAGPLYVIPIHVMFACGFGSVALGVSRVGLDAGIALSREKVVRFGETYSDRTRRSRRRSVRRRQSGARQRRCWSIRRARYESRAGIEDHLRRGSNRPASGRDPRHSSIRGGGGPRVQPVGLRCDLLVQSGPTPLSRCPRHHSAGPRS